MSIELINIMVTWGLVCFATLLL
ncbi:hypothetical protein CBM2595_A80011 [Cupriavidus taiwanensis]|nr:hypothetical protein CBM2595_A80011 [Cupriavidus taiwanensis]